MTTWTNDELERIGNAQELRLTSARADGSLRPFTTMWVVRAGDEIYVRSAGGPERAWFRHAKTNGAGRIRAGRVERNVTFGEATADAQTAIDTAYHEKYDQYGPNIVGHVVGPAARAVTVRLRPAPEKE
jgi:hypothetical protein